MSPTRVLLLCALSTVWLYLAGTREDLVIVCPDDYSPSPSEDCVPLHQLLSTLHLIYSNTTIQLLPAVFKLGPDLSISIANVSNITVGAAGPHRATISCTGANSGFVFKNVSGLTLQSMNITNCASYMNDSKLSVAIFESANVTLIYVKFMTSGVYAENIWGSLIMFDALLTEMDNSSGFYLILTKLRCANNVLNSEYKKSSFIDNQMDASCYLSLHFSDVALRSNIVHTPLFYINTSQGITVNTTFHRFKLENNKIFNPSPAYQTYGIFMFGTAQLTINNSTFSNNQINAIELSFAESLVISNSVFANNRGSAVNAFMLYYTLKHNIVIQQTTFVNNTSIDQDSTVHFVISSLSTLNNLLLQDCTFSNNIGTGLMLENSVVDFSGTNLFINNTAHSGAAIILKKSSFNITKGRTTLNIQGNVAERYGGGILVPDTGNEECFINTYEDSAVIFNFANNVAHLAGNDIYGGNVYSCTSPTIALQSPPGYKMDVTSQPTRVCKCNNSNCVHSTKVIDTIETYPGKTFNLSLLAVGQVLNLTVLSGAPSAVYANILPQESTAKFLSGKIPGGMFVQKGLRSCFNLTYSINSTREDEILALSTEDLSKSEITQYWLRYPDNDNDYVPTYVDVHFLPCPAGFNLSRDGGCICSSALITRDVECNIDTLMIHRKSPYYWLAFTNISGKVLAHRYCPFGYCNPDVLDFSLADTDALCNHNRSGILCGACRSGYSLILGGTECRRCSNIYLLLLLPFALAGILLVVFLSLTDITVAAGTINGLLFYANIVADNKATFFPPGAEDSFLSVFVQWLSLDLGIKSCFFDGLDAYTYTWLQLVFPVYVCLLAFTIIIASRYITWMDKLCGTNIVQVLATLFLLSYTKLQATIASALSFTAVEVYDEEKLFVWLKDGNVRYLLGKHIALFLVSLLLLCVFSLYTLSIALGPWLQRKTQYKVFCWVLKFKPLFDAYFGPLKNQYRYWTGLLFLSRIVLYLVSSVNVLGDDSINLLAIAIVCLLLTWQTHSVYKHRVLSALDSFFLINLCILSLVSLHNKLSSEDSQTVTIYVSCGSAFAIFCVILFYHCFSRLKKVISERRHNLAFREGLSVVEDADEKILDIIDADR